MELPLAATSQSESPIANDYEAQKDARVYGGQAFLRAGETSTITVPASGTDLDEREPGLNDGYNQSVIIGTPMQTSLAPIQQLRSIINISFI